MSLPQVLQPLAYRSGGNQCVACEAPVFALRCHECGAPQSVRGYRVLRVLARTPHSRVYLVEDVSGRRVALKELLFAEAPDVATITAFEREALILKALDHPSIPKLIESFQDGSGPGLRLYLAQEFVAGETLRERLERGPISAAELKELALRVLEILEWLHGRTPPLFHRDIKPQNLILRSDGGLALVDFGSAREVARGITHGASLVGTFGYAPMEQLGGTVTASSDLYALGATLIHLLTGKAPDTLFNPSTMTLDFEPWVKFPRWSAFLRGMVARDPAGRFPSAREARLALTAKEPIRPKVAPPPPRMRRFGRARWGLALGIVVGAGILYSRPALSPRPVLAEQRHQMFRPLSVIGRYAHGPVTAQLWGMDAKWEGGKVRFVLDLDATNESAVARPLGARPKLVMRNAIEVAGRLYAAQSPPEKRLIGAGKSASWTFTYLVPADEWPVRVEFPDGTSQDIDIRDEAP